MLPAGLPGRAAPVLEPSILPCSRGAGGITLWVGGALLLRAGVWAVVGTERTWALGPTGTWMTSGGRGGLSRMPLVSRDAESCFSAQSWGFGSGKCVSHGEGPSAGLRGYFSYLLIVLGIPAPRHPGCTLSAWGSGRPLPEAPLCTQATLQNMWGPRPQD